MYVSACSQAASNNFDMTLHGDNCTISCHSAILIQSMPLLARMSSFNNLVLPGFTLPDLKLLLTFAYSAGHR